MVERGGEAKWEARYSEKQAEISHKATPPKATASSQTLCGDGEGGRRVV
jgi:hypothetical protein